MFFTAIDRGTVHKLLESINPPSVLYIVLIQTVLSWWKREIMPATSGRF